MCGVPADAGLGGLGWEIKALILKCLTAVSIHRLFSILIYKIWKILALFILKGVLNFLRNQPMIVSLH